MIQTIDRYYTLLLRGMMALAALYLAAIMVAILYFTTFRGLGIPYSGTSFIFIEYGFLYMMMLGSPWLVRIRGHVYIEIVTAAVPDTVRPWMSRIVAGLAAIACLLLAIYTGDVFWQDWVNTEIDVRGSTDIPRWIATISMPLGFGLMTIEFLRFVFGRDTMHTGEAGVHE